MNHGYSMSASPIRPFQEADVEAIIDVWREASLLAHPFLSADFLEREQQKIRQVFLPKAETWVYEDGGRLVGFLSLLGDEVGAIFVHPSTQRRGVGRALMDKACSMHDSLELDARPGDPAADGTAGGGSVLRQARRSCCPPLYLG